MSYLTLYRKYRPQKFKEVIGQDHIVKILCNAIELDRLAHAYLFSGPRGTGKTTIARIFAKALNCRKGVSINPCQKCDLCQSISLGTAVDTIEIDAASNRGIDEIRQLREGVYFTPIEGQYKVYIIDEAHMLTDPAFNALLKTLEEPPPKTIFVLATTEAHKIPLTILSRCQRMDLKLIKQSDIEKKLIQILGTEQVEFEEKAIKIIAREANGSLRDAISLLDQLISFRKEKVKLEDVFLILGTTEEGQILDLFDSLVRGEVKLLLDIIERLTEEGKNLVQVCRALICYFRGMLMIKLGFYDLVDLDEESIAKLKKYESKINMECLKKSIGFLGKIESEMKWHSPVKLYLEISLMELIGIIEGEMAVLGKEKKEDNITIEKEAKIEKKQESAEGLGSLDLMTIKHSWHDVLMILKDKKISVYTLMCEGELAKYEDNNLKIIFKKGYSFHKEKMSEELNKRLLEDVLAKTYNLGIKVRFYVEGEQSKDDSVSLIKDKEIEREKGKDLETDRLVELFEGKVIDK